MTGLHFFEGFDTKNVKAGFQKCEGSIAEQESSCPNGFIIHHDFVGIVECAEGNRQFI